MWISEVFGNLTGFDNLLKIQDYSNRMSSLTLTVIFSCILSLIVKATIFSMITIALVTFFLIFSSLRKVHRFTLPDVPIVFLV